MNEHRQNMPVTSGLNVKHVMQYVCLWADERLPGLLLEQYVHLRDALV